MRDASQSSFERESHNSPAAFSLSEWREPTNSATQRCGRGPSEEEEEEGEKMKWENAGRMQEIVLQTENTARKLCCSAQVEARRDEARQGKEEQGFYIYDINPKQRLEAQNSSVVPTFKIAFKIVIEIPNKFQVVGNDLYPYRQ